MTTFIFIMWGISLVLNTLLIIMLIQIDKMLSKHGLSIQELFEKEIVLISERQKVIRKTIEEYENQIKINQKKIDEYERFFNK